MLAKKLQGAGGAAAPIRFVGAYSAGLGTVSTGTTFTFGGNLTGGLSSSPVQGDIVFIALSSSNGSDVDLNVTGWVEVADLYANNTGTTADAVVGLYYKVMGASPDTSGTVTASSSCIIYATAYVLRNVDTSLPLDATSTTATGVGTGVVPNPPSITPSTVGAGILVFGAAAGTGSTTRLTASYLSDFSGNGSGFAEIGIGMVYNWQSGAYDPAAFGGGGAATRAWGAVTVALRPLYTGAKPTFIASASTTNSVSQTTIVVNKPAGTIEGDLMVAVMGAGTTGTGYTWTGATGWTELCDQNTGTNLRVAYKVATASEPSSYTFTLNTSVSSKGASILTFRGATYDAIGSIAAGASPLVVTGPTAAASFSYLIGVAARAAASITVTAPSSMTTLVTDNDGTAPSYVVAGEYVIAGATGTRSFVVGSTTNVAGVLLTIKPA